MINNTNIKPVNITDIVSRLQMLPAGQTISTELLQKIIASLISDPRGIAGLSFKIGQTTVKGKELLRLLASTGLNPQQMTNVIYGLYHGVRITGKFSPAEDNLIHVRPEQLKEMAKNSAIQKHLYLVSLSIERDKSPEPLYQKPKSQIGAPSTGILPGLPDSIKNPQSAGVAAAGVSFQAEKENIIYQPDKLIMAVTEKYLPEKRAKLACNILLEKGETQ
ncbi:MAG: hypothetical protein FD145_322 [Candidatus Saganbacteria bacterium]|uniref:Uncharacterized protein n=1 Tax=Candidatus Saganbacteria bacterium TaxID=2575572 RepID=A0A833L218_UNCSA|nr:MAG: hypothetical protein FD145_322 [Candidatus Saganbacteria bacterium]